MGEATNNSVKTIFLRAVELREPEREAFIIGACAGDEALCERVRGLLRAFEQGEGFMGNPTAGVTRHAAVLSEGPGTRIGPYKLLQLIGEGGFGSVFMAEQERPVVRRVALKIIKLGMDTRQVIARFEAERQALAMMDHPNIARVFDAGATEAGRPYFVMELVRGDPITEYCDKHNLSTRERVALAAQVCQAVQHAHQKGIIHRDIKPSNILVTVADGRPIPKVIDFGIAKATAGRLTEKTLFTEHRQLIGTPEYMSPEQAEMSGVDIDTRSDIYSLGVLLYELLTGSTPFDGGRLRSAAFDEVCRIIREEEPPRPSVRVSTLGSVLPGIAARRGEEPRRLGAIMRHDLDWVVMKCLDKDRTRRYDTASALAGDLQSYLEDRPVTAARPGAWRRLSRFVRRNRRRVSAVATVVGMVCGSIYIATRTIEFHESERAREEREAVALLARTSRLMPAKAEEIQPAVDRIVQRIMSGRATPQETQRFLEVIEPPRFGGRPLQKLGDAKVYLNLNRRLDVKTYGLFLIPTLSAQSYDAALGKEEKAPDPFALKPEVWDGIGTGQWLTRDAFASRGQKKLHGTVTFRVARLPKEFEHSSMTAYNQTAKPEIIGPPISISVADAEYSVVDELPDDYPMPIKSEATGAALRERMTVRACMIEAIGDGKGVALSLKLRFDGAPPEFALESECKLKISVAGRPQQLHFIIKNAGTWQCLGFNTVLDGDLTGLEGSVAGGWTIEPNMRWLFGGISMDSVRAGGPAGVCHITVEPSQDIASQDGLIEAYADFEPLEFDVPVTIAAPKP